MAALVATFSQLHEMGCIQTGADVHDDVRVAEKRMGGLFAAVVGLSHGNPCPGCPALQGGKCRAYLAFNTGASKPIVVPPTVASNSLNYPGMSVRQIAEKLGVSMNEVRRRKLAGTL